MTNTFILSHASTPNVVWIMRSIFGALEHIYRHGIGGWTMKTNPIRRRT